MARDNHPASKKGKFDQVVDKKSYHITYLITKSYNRLLLTTNKKTNFEEISTSHAMDWNDILEEPATLTKNTSNVEFFF